MDFELSRARFFGHYVDMPEVGSGHWCINLEPKAVECHINDIKSRHSKVLEVILSTEVLDEKTIKRLHHLYGHTSANKLNKFLVKAGRGSDGIKRTLEEVAKPCEACAKSRRRVPKPKFAIPRANKPNEIVTIDLKEFNLKHPTQKYICYFIDMFSRLTVGVFIPAKKAEVIMEALLINWVGTPLGKMEMLHSDLGGEMSNEVMEDVAAALDVKLTTTSAYSPHQNGVNEKNHAIVDLMMTRMIASDSKMTAEMALRWH